MLSFDELSKLGVHMTWWSLDGRGRALQAENSALHGLVVDLAANKAEARSRLAQLKEKYNHLLSGVRPLS
jgi:hypothetical protein